MDLSVLKKKISTFRSEGGKLRKVSDELLLEILQAWEGWTGPANGFYTAVGVHRRKMASMLGKAKRLKREGHFAQSEFKEISIENNENPCIDSQPMGHIEMVWSNNKIIKFNNVDILLEFLKKAA